MALDVPHSLTWSHLEHLGTKGRRRGRLRCLVATFCDDHQAVPCNSRRPEPLAHAGAGRMRVPIGHPKPLKKKGISKITYKKSVHGRSQDQQRSFTCSRRAFTAFVPSFSDQRPVHWSRCRAPQNPQNRWFGWEDHGCSSLSAKSFASPSVHTLATGQHWVAFESMLGCLRREGLIHHRQLRIYLCVLDYPSIWICWCLFNHSHLFVVLYSSLLIYMDLLLCFPFNQSSWTTNNHSFARLDHLPLGWHPTGRASGPGRSSKLGAPEVGEPDILDGHHLLHQPVSGTSERTKSYIYIHIYIYIIY